jgi:uncharacterized membrane protein (TIGR02234 family)
VSARSASGRRELTVVVLAALLGALSAWVVAGRVWAQGSVGSAEDLLRVSATGNDLSAAVTALALAGLAGALALFATRKLGRQLIGVLLVAAGVGVVGAALGAHGDGKVRGTLAAKATAKGVSGAVSHLSVSPYWLVAVLGGVIVALAGLVTVVRGRGWPGMSARYDNPAGRAERVREERAAQAASAKGLWDALDRGEDPTGS